MSKYKLAAFDMDGTLLDSQHQIRQDSLDAMEKATLLGKTFCLSTGRNLAELEEYRKQLPMIQYLMCISGALIVDNYTGKTVYEKSIEQENVLKLFELAKEYDVIYHIHSDKSRFQKEDLDKLKAYGMGQYKELFEKVSTFHKDLYKDYLSNPYPVYKFNYYCRDTEVRSALEKEIVKLPVTACYAEGKSLECSPLGISKASGLQYLCSHLGCTIDETIAVGDADNDIEIIKAAGLGIAMGNSKETVLAIADAVVADNNSGGIKEVIDKYLIGEE